MKPIVPLLLAVSLLAGLLAWRSHRDATAASLALSELHSAHRPTETRLRDAADRLARTQQMAADLRSRLSPASVSRDAPPAPPPQRARDLSRLIADDPNLQNLQLAARRAQLAITYAPFYRLAALTPQQIQTFEQNLLRYEERQSDILAAARNRHEDLGDPAYQKLYADAASDYQSAQHALLGEAGAKQFAGYEGTAPARETVSALVGATAMAGLPLDGSQAEQLARVVDAAIVKSPTGWSMADVDWRLVHEQAKTFLSPAQLTFIETTESAGPRGAGSRFLPALQGAIMAAAKEDAAAPHAPASP